MKNLSNRMEAVQSPVIPIVGQLIRDNPGTISLGQGVVSYSPPPESFELLSQFFSDRNNHKYKAVRGISPLLTAIEAKLALENKIAIGNKNTIVVTAGSNMAFTNALLAITSAGDEVILNTPYYFNHEMATIMANCKPVLIKTDEKYQPRIEAIAKAITNKTRAIVTISPNNPTGVIYPESTLREINQLCRERGIYHINDEAYEYFTYDGVKHFSPAAIADSEGHTISLYSLSKAYGFASWRIGYMVVPSNLLNAIEKIQDTILICPPVISQYAAIGALQAGVDYCKNYLKEIDEVRKIVLESLKSIDDLIAIVPGQGAFYFFIKVDTQIEDFLLVKKLIQDYRVAVLPGSTFGIKDGCYLRIAYGSLAKETAAAGIERLVKGLREMLEVVQEFRSSGVQEFRSSGVQ
jgi:aspartate/methionine/tyrosine aminotransferase